MLSPTASPVAVTPLPAFDAASSASSSPHHRPHQSMPLPLMSTATSLNGSNELLKPTPLGKKKIKFTLHGHDFSSSSPLAQLLSPSTVADLLEHGTETATTADMLQETNSQTIASPSLQQDLSSTPPVPSGLPPAATQSPGSTLVSASPDALAKSSVSVTTSSATETLQSPKRSLPPLPSALSLRRNSTTGTTSPVPRIAVSPVRAVSAGLDKSPTSPHVRASQISRSERDREREKARDAAAAAAAAAAKASKSNNSTSNSKGGKKPTSGSVYKTVHVPEIPKTLPEHVRDFFLSLRFFFLGMLIASLVTVSVLSWNLTYQAAQDSIALVMNDYSDVLLNQIVSDLDRRFLAVEHVTTINKKYFKRGLLAIDNDANRVDTLAHFNLQTQEYIKDTLSSLSYTTKNGDLNGFGYYVTPTLNKHVGWTQNGSLMIENSLDNDGNIISQNFASVVDNTESAWYQAINDTDPNSSGFTPPYVFYGTWFISQSSTIVDTTGRILGCVTSDVVLGFLDNIAKQMASSSSVGAQFVIIDSKTGFLLGTSIADYSLSNDSDPNNVVGKDLAFPGNPSLLTTLYDFILKKSGRTNTSITSLYRNLPGMNGEVSVDGKKLLVNVRGFEHQATPPPNASDSTVAWMADHSIDWVLVHCLDRSEVEHQIATSNNKVLITVVCICAGFIVAMTLLLWYSLRLIKSLSKLLTSFARFEFRGHVEGGQLKDRSIFVELRQMQDAVMEMTKAFKQHLDGQAKMFHRGSSSPVATGQPGASTGIATGATSAQASNGISKPPSAGVSRPISPPPFPRSNNPNLNKSKSMSAGMVPSSLASPSNPSVVSITYSKPVAAAMSTQHM